MSNIVIEEKRRGWFWRLLFGEPSGLESPAKWQARLDRERAENLKPGFRGGDVIALPITGDIINTKKIYAIQVDQQTVILHMEGFQRFEVPCDNHADALTVRDNIARVMDIREGPSY